MKTVPKLRWEWVDKKLQARHYIGTYMLECSVVADLNKPTFPGLRWFFSYTSFREGNGSGDYFSTWCDKDIKRAIKHVNEMHRRNIYWLKKKMDILRQTTTGE